MEIKNIGILMLLFLVHGLLHRPHHVQGHPWLHPHLNTPPIPNQYYSPLCLEADSNQKPKQNTGHDMKAILVPDLVQTSPYS